MSVDLTGFDASKVEPSGSGTPIPKGEYQVVMIESEKAATKAGDGALLKLVFQVIEGEHKGRKLTSRLNLWNASEKAKVIAQGQLSAICRAVNVLTPRDTGELHNRQLTVAVDVDPQPDGRIFNKIDGYKPRQSAAPVAAPGGGFSGKPNPFG